MNAGLQRAIRGNSIPEPNSGCWLWEGGMTRDGYGLLSGARASIVSFTAFGGVIPSGLVLDHLCRVRCCVNPDHLEPVTVKVNTNRGLRTKLSDVQVAAIRELYSTRHFTQFSLARLFSVDQSLISLITSEKHR